VENDNNIVGSFKLIDAQHDQSLDLNTVKQKDRELETSPDISTANTIVELVETQTDNEDKLNDKLKYVAEIATKFIRKNTARIGVTAIAALSVGGGVIGTATASTSTKKPLKTNQIVPRMNPYKRSNTSKVKHLETMGQINSYNKNYYNTKIVLGAGSVNVNEKLEIVAPHLFLRKGICPVLKYNDPSIYNSKENIANASGDSDWACTIPGANQAQFGHFTWKDFNFNMLPALYFDGLKDAESTGLTSKQIGQADHEFMKSGTINGITNTEIDMKYMDGKPSGLREIEELVTEFKNGIGHIATETFYKARSARSVSK
jgi:hypothetical protein